MRASPCALLRREGHAEEVELDVRAALDDREVVIEDRVRVGVADDDARRVGALLLEDPELGEPDRDSTPWVVMASPVRRAARAAARWTRSSAGETHGLSVPISPMIPGRTPVPHPVGRLAHQLVGEVVDRAPVDARLGRVVGRPVPAAAHDDVQAAGARRGRRSQAGSRPTPGSVRSTSAAPAGRPEACQLLEDDRLVAGQLPVVPAARDVPQRDLGVLVRQGEAEVVRVDRAEDGLDVGHGPRCYAVGTGSRVMRARRRRRRAAARRWRSPGARGRPGDTASPASIRWSIRPSSSARKPRVTASTSSDGGSSPLITPGRRSIWPAPARC